MNTRSSRGMPLAASQVLISMAVLISAILAGLALYKALAPQRSCRLFSPAGTTNLWSICADTLRLPPQDGFVGDEFAAIGNVTIGLEPNPPSVMVRDLGPEQKGMVIWANNPVLGRKVALVNGDVGFVKANTEGRDMLVTSGYNYFFDLDPDNNPRLVSDKLEFDPFTGRIANTLGVLHDRLEGEVHAGFYLLWADTAAVLGDTGIFDADLVSRKDLSMTLDLHSKLFTATVPVTLPVNNIAADDVKLGLRVVFNENGFVTGGLGDFSAKVGPVAADLSNIILRPGEFEADEIEIMADKNPDLTMLADPAPAKPGLLFKFKGLLYKDRKWSIKGGEVAIRDMMLGDVVKLANNRIGIDYEAAPSTQALLSLKSTLSFGDYFTASQPISTQLKIGVVSATVEGVSKLRPAWTAGIAGFTGDLGSMKLVMNNVNIVGDPVGNFYGLSANTVALKWGDALGGQTGAGMSGLKLGADRARKFKFELNGGTLSTPQIKSKVFEGNIVGTVGVISNTAMFTFTGNVAIKLPGGASNPNGGGSLNPSVQLLIRTGKNAKADCGAQVAPACVKRVDGSLAGMGIKLAGFSVTVTNPKIVGDGGGFYASQASLKLPDNLGGLGATVNGLAIGSDGKVTITGGNFSMPPIKIGKMELKVSGGFVTEPGPNDTVLNVFTGAGELKLPSVTATGSRKITANVTIKTVASTGALNEFDTVLAFTATAGNGIPIGTTGTELLAVSGQVNIKTNTLTLNFGVGVATQLRLGPIPVVRLDASTSIKVDPFKMTLDAALKVLIFEIGAAHVEIGDGAGFFPISGCPDNGSPQCVRAPGFYATISVNALFFHGDAAIRVERRASGVVFAGWADLDFGLRKGQFGAGLPRQDRTLASIRFAVGEFNIPNQSANTFGAKGDFEIIGWDYSIFMDWNKTGLSALSMGHNLDGYVFVPNVAALQRAMAGEPGWEMNRTSLATGDTLWDARALTLQRGEAAEQLLVQDVASALNVTYTYQAPAGSNSYIGVQYTGTAPAPTVALILPGGTVITQGNAGTFTPFSITFESDLSVVPTRTSDIGFALSKGTAGGTYRLVVSNAPADATLLAYSQNAKPIVSDPQYASPRGLPLGLRWASSDVDSPNATQDIGYTRVDTRTNTPIIEAAVWLSMGLPLTDVNYFPPFNTNEVASGVYAMIIKVDDKKNAPIFKTAPQLITVTDVTPPAVPAGLQADALPNGLHIKWTPSPQQDVHGYEIGWGTSNNPATFVFTRDIGWRGGADAALLAREGLERMAALRRPVSTGDLLTVQAGQADETFGGMADGQPIFWSVRAYDQNLNYSAWSTVRQSQPWGLAPKAYTPGDGGTGDGRFVEVAFNEPLNATGLTDMLVVRRVSDGSVVTGTVAPIVDIDGVSIVGLRFRSGTLLSSGDFYATLGGGGSGVQALSGRSMNSDFVWAFRMSATTDPDPDPIPPPPAKRIVLPLVRR